MYNMDTFCVYFYKERDAEHVDCIDLSVDKVFLYGERNGEKGYMTESVALDAAYIGVDCR